MRPVGTANGGTYRVASAAHRLARNSSPSLTCDDAPDYTKLGKQALSASRLNACILISQGALRLAKGINSGQRCAVEEPHAGSDAPKVTATGSDRDTLGHHADAGSQAREPVECRRFVKTDPLAPIER